MDQVKRIAMWAVPRSLATVLIRSWENRPDTMVWDEPLLAPYVFHKGEDFGFTREQVIEAKVETDWFQVVKNLTGSLPEDKTICYQKHQPHELLEEIIGLKWIEQLTNCFLIRHPQDMLLSLYKIVPDFTFEQTGWLKLQQLFDYVCATTKVILPVIDARDLQDNPRGTLCLLCNAVGVEFTETMLNWPAKNYDALPEQEKKWYGSAFKSTHFQSYKPKFDVLPDHLLGIFDKCNEIYQQLYKYRLHTNDSQINS